MVFEFGDEKGRARYLPGLLLAVVGGVILFPLPGWVTDWSWWGGAVAAGAGALLLLVALIDGLWTAKGDTVPFDRPTLKIAHLSDLHFPTRSNEAADALRVSLRTQAPDILVITGDLQNHPVIGAEAARKWIAETARDWCGITDPKRVIVLPGNHDLFVTGLFGIGPLGEWLFRRTHKAPRTGVIYVKTANVVFLCLDLNPLFAVVSAEGTVYEHRLRALAEAMEKHPEQAGIQSATRILLVHQHPFPVPYCGTDFLLSTRETHRLLRFVAEKRIQVILHGHKHFATWSDLRIGGGGDYPRFVQILGAGSAMKRSDFDTRGHNYNVLTISDVGVRRTRQFFKPADQKVFVEKAPSASERIMQNMVGAAFGPQYQVGEIEWAVTVGGDGVATNHYKMKCISMESQEQPLIRVRGHEDVGGQRSRYLIAEGPPDWSLSRVEMGENDAPGDPDYVLHCPGGTGGNDHSVTLAGHEFGSYAINGLSALNLELPLVPGTQEHEDFLRYPLREAVKVLRLSVEFPASFVIFGESMRVFEMWGGARNLRPGGRALPAPVKNGRTLSITITDPEPNLIYQLSWRVPAVALESRDELAHARRRVFAINLWNGKDKAQTELNRVVALVGQIIIGQLQETLETEVLPDLEYDISVMIPTKDAPRKLGILTGSKVKDEAFRMRIGCGNAGLAYLGGATQYFDVDRAAKNAMTDTYFPNAAGNKHSFLASYPLLDTRTKLPFAVVSLGAIGTDSGKIMLPIAESECQEKILTELHRDVLPELFRLASMKERPGNEDCS